MTGEEKKKKRRRIQIDGQSIEDVVKTSKPRSLDQILRLEEESEEEAPQTSSSVMWDQERLKKFISGQITLADLEGITKQEQYQLAEIGYSYLMGGNLANAKTVFDGLLALDPFDAYFHMAIASIAQQQEKYEEAEAAYTRSLEINPFSPTAYANRGEVRVMSGKLAEGAEDLVRAVKEDPDGKEPATQRAKATILVLQEQLGSIEKDNLEERKTETRVRVAASVSSQDVPDNDTPKSDVPTPDSAKPVAKKKKKTKQKKRPAPRKQKKKKRK